MCSCEDAVREYMEMAGADMKSGASYYVEVVAWGDNDAEHEDGAVVKRLGPMTERRADRVEDGLNVNLDHERFFTRVVRERPSGG